MPGRTALVWDPSLGAYDFGEHHPLRPVRVELAVELSRACGVLDAMASLTPADLTRTDLETVHDPAYIDAVARISASDPEPFAHHGWGIGPQDTQAFTGMHEASARVCGATTAAARAVWQGAHDHAFSPAGGLHHAMRARAAGFCVYNDPAVAIAWLLENGAHRVAYVDVDVHHGDGVQAIFYDDPRVLTISLHESGRYLFPGTGFADEIGAGDAAGTSVNVALPPATLDDMYLAAFDQIVPPLVTAFAPDVLVTQLGCDTHATDPLAHLGLTTRTYRAVARALHELAHDVCGGRWVATGGGGYQLFTVVPRAWTIAAAEMAGVELPAETPEEWRALARERGAPRVPEHFDDGAVALQDLREGDVAEQVRRAVAETRARMVPYYDLG